MGQPTEGALMVLAMKVRGVRRGHLCDSLFVPFRQVLSLNLSQAGSQQTPATFLSPTLSSNSTEGTGTGTHKHLLWF